MRSATPLATAPWRVGPYDGECGAGPPRTARRPGKAPMPPRPAHLRPELMAAVFAGGAGGTMLRAQLLDAFPATAGQWPWSTLAVNVTGALLLGVLLQAVALRGPDEGPRRLLRLGLGTGVLGGYTTYSTFAVESVALARDGHGALAVAYDGVSLAAGALAAWVGILAVDALARARAGGGRR